MAGVKEMALVSAEQTGLVQMLERLAVSPDVPVEKLEKLLDMQERILLKQSEDAFNDAMATAQEEMRPIAADAENPQTRSKYASYAQLDRALRPIYTKHGFALSYDQGEGAPPDHVRVLCYASRRGFTRTYKLDMPNDGKGAKGGDVMTKTHATGAAMSYGMRYLLKMIFNVAVGEDDRDGNIVRQAPPAPEGFENWLIDLQATADNGIDALRAAWKNSKPAFRDHLNIIDQSELGRLKAKAEKVKA